MCNSQKPTSKQGRSEAVRLKIPKKKKSVFKYLPTDFLNPYSLRSWVFSPLQRWCTDVFLSPGEGRDGKPRTILSGVHGDGYIVIRTCTLPVTTTTPDGTPVRCGVPAFGVRVRRVQMYYHGMRSSKPSFFFSLSQTTIVHPPTGPPPTNVFALPPASRSSSLPTGFC